MIYRTVSSKQIVAKVMRDFGTQDTTWLYDAIEWIGEAIQSIGAYAGTVKKSSGNYGTNDAVTVENHRAALPCDLESLIAVEYNGQRLPYGSDQTGYGLICHDRTTDMSPKSQSGPFEILEGTHTPIETLKNLELLHKAATGLDGEYYLVNPNYIITSFESGHIKLHYNAFPTDKDGFPMVPDTYGYRSALAWYILKMLLSSGHPHPVFQYKDAEERWFEYRGIATTDAKYPSVDQMERFRNQWVRLIPQTNAWSDFFMNSEQQEELRK